MQKARMLTAGGLFGITTLLGVAPAAAVPPNANQYTLNFAAGEYCTFAVSALVTDNQTYVFTEMADGSTLLTFRGAAFATVINDVTGESVDLNISGPGNVVFRPDGTFSGDVKGPNFLQTTVANSATGVPTLNFTRGRATYEVADGGITAAFALSGNSTDICAVLG